MPEHRRAVLAGSVAISSDTAMDQATTGSSSVGWTLLRRGDAGGRMIYEALLA